MYRVFSLIIFLIFFGRVCAQQPSDYNNTKPKVVVGLVIENMRPDYVQRYWNKFQPDGFKKLFSQGAVCTNIKLTQHYQNYASGTATLFTGVNPSTHGIVGKTWYDRLRSKEAECTEDDYYFTVGADSKYGNASPKKLLSNTITDNLKIFSQGKSLVYSVAMNRESSIFSAGHAADGAFWYDPETGRMVSSSFYISTFPDWVRDFNSENYGERYSYQNWVTLRPEKEYTESLPDNYIFEKGYFDNWNTFPHTIGKYTRKAELLTPIKTTPYANEIVKEFALKLFENVPFGQDDHTDFATFVFSSMDYENGSFGPASLEMQDSYLYLDKYIAEVINVAEKKFGKQNVLFFLTANTSASYPVDYLKEEFHLPVDHFSPESALALLTSYLNITYGEGNWIEYDSNLQVYLNHDLIKKNKIDLYQMQEEASNFLNQFEGVQLSMTAYQLEQGSSTSGLLATLDKSYVKNRSGDFLYLLKEGWQPSYKFKKVNFTDQSHIPLVFYGAGIQPQYISEQYNAIDLVPTLSDLMQIPRPDKSSGITITPVLNTKK
ncbi:Type I phosphodiesterase / nucleotide pyrophosphatase [Mariniphaga anaerophila]|uniref:Type I phosphodiesterase / nucleotide pyrophosphatase n=1 Tax=Mariniphaga anaerophila TaxID=1484053 RepID=A0A1M4TQF3_9BACT|nr:alkaline phosphatase family protein [Mariniphaga anaerophila]SHE46658.1 Type I phosphodiesterase / nucleotide pyrophosphatase [Mariniphaga anaerophila]